MMMSSEADLSTLTLNSEYNLIVDISDALSEREKVIINYYKFSK